MKNIPDKSSTAKKDWHSYDESEVFSELDTSLDGLALSEVENRLEFYGENKLPSGKKISLLKIIFNQVISPLIIILIAAAIASILIGEEKDAIFILLVIIINSGLGAYQEYNAEKSAEALQSLLKIKASVKREKSETEVDSEELVPGDIVLLKSGKKVPADIRLSEATNLSIDESLLTGESVAVKKTPGKLDSETAIADRTNMAFAGSTVMSGSGLGIVVATGVYTQAGQIAEDVSESVSAKPPLVLRMERFIKQISIFIIALSVILAVILRINGMDFGSIFFFVVALAVSAIPEGLPVALTVALSIATKRMSKRNVLVRRLTAVESLGSCTVIASDKTGTLTVNKQTAKKILLPNGEIFSITGDRNSENGKAEDHSEQEKNIYTLNRIAVLANEASLKEESGDEKHRGNAMDVALLGMSEKLGIEPKSIRSKYKIIDEIPYESERKFSATFFEVDNSVHVAAKGALETILDLCNLMADGETTKDIDKEMILNQADDLASKGFRLLAFAGGEHKDFEKKEQYDNDSIPDLVFYGLVGFIDPLRKEAKSSVKKCKDAGIKVIMITGDHPSTAKTISQELGIADKNTKIVTGQMLSEASESDDNSFEELVGSTSVFARVSPGQKLEIIDLLVKDGEFVAVTGDGVNDAPALKRANIGVAMGSGTDVAKEVGSMIVIDDNFSSIVAGVEEGRFAYDNVRKVIYLLISTGAAEIFLFIASIIAGLPLPLLAVQLLWLNLVTNGIQDVSLAFEGGEPNAMKKKPRKTGESIFNPLMIKQTVVSGVIMGSIVFGYWYWLNNYSQMEEFHARNIVLLLMVFMQNFHAFNCRSELTSAFKVPLNRNWILVFGVLAAQGIHILSMQLPFMQSLLRIDSITLNEWFQVLILAVPILIGMEVFKLIMRRNSTDR